MPFNPESLKNLRQNRRQQSPSQQPATVDVPESAPMIGKDQAVLLPVESASASENQQLRRKSYPKRPRMLRSYCSALSAAVSAPRRTFG
jgi:hypothetical protein